jgi:hypothetical protein
MQLITIFIVFSITGSLSVLLGGPLLEIFDSKITDNIILYIILRIILIFPIYQVLILLVGWLFGQFKFFWNFERKILEFIGFKRNNN